MVRKIYGNYRNWAFFAALQDNHQDPRREAHCISPVSVAGTSRTVLIFQR
ncbi:MAG: hypothetical protein R2758_04280 [Bacteroidales bacterium]